MSGDPLLIRAACLFVPLLAVTALAVHRPPAHRALGAALVATAWQAVTLPAVNLLAVRAGWWTFHADGGTVAGLPVDLLLGWALLWGAVPVLLRRPLDGRLPLLLTVAALAWLDLVAMPLADPVVRLGDAWLLGEAAAVLVCLVPGLLLGRWTLQRRHTARRAGAQMLLSGALMVGLPLLTTGPGIPGGVTGLTLVAQVVAVPLLLGVVAVREFVQRGGGTPVPYDPPVRLVTSGPYAYVRNPMQLSIVLTFLVLGAAAGDWRLLAAAATAFAYGAGLADWHENAWLRDRHGEGWDDYRAGVRAWVPRLRPWPGTAGARLYVAATCTPCSGFGRWITRRRPVALRIVPAEQHPGRLRRLTYESDDGRVRAEGVAAVGRLLGHLHLGWALAGWLLAVPGLGWFAQLCADAFGAGPRDLTPASAEPPAPQPHG
ncbi:methyltransferase [Streptomyces sp. 549]|uniref:methyltransferase family protein n=1 Tax=Streptomyces sp. 549 TaxID=3049076 RepID=UPI0024C3AF4F|nr:methyltransferase [Streptomyces sp. 549]MDK1476130.1 methyltransferase [Streptomyces sp. 549]